MNLVFEASVLELPFTGIAKTSLMLYQQCLALDPALTITGVQRKASSDRVPAGIRVVRCGRLFSASRWRSFSLPRQIKSLGATAVHFPWSGGIPENLGDRTVAMTLHDVLPLEIPGCFKNPQDEERYRFDRQRDIDRCQVVFTDSHYSKLQIEKNFRLQSEPVVNYFGPTLAEGSGAAAEPAAGKEPYFVYLGGYDRRKGIEELLDVFLELHRQGKLNGRLLLVGKSHYFSDRLRRLIEEGTATGIVREMGYLPDAELVGVLKNAQALVYPSRYEGFGLPPLEAMNVGCPVITTSRTSIPEICGEAVLYIDPADGCGFGRALCSIENEPELRNNLRAAGRLQAAKFTWRKSAETFIDNLKRASVAGKRP